MPESDTHSGSATDAMEQAKGGGVLRQPYYVATPGDRLRSFGEGLRLRLSSRKVLIVGPYAGEFGHEIIDFQSYVRWIKRKYREVHVITFPGREPLYRGCLVHSHQHDLSAAGYGYGRISHSEIRAEAHEFAHAHRIADYDLFSTIHLCTRWHRKLLLREEHEVIAPLQPRRPNQRIVFHFRSIDKAGPDQSRNYRPDLAEEVCRLCRISGLEVACIGHPQYALSPRGSEDCRTEDLEATLAEIAACRLVVGELSGPLHLAVYSARPVAIWAPHRWRIDNALQHNPFQTRIFVIRDDTTNPSPHDILAAVQGALSTLK